jgi:hypothetical protein
MEKNINSDAAAEVRALRQLSLPATNDDCSSSATSITLSDPPLGLQSIMKLLSSALPSLVEPKFAAAKAAGGLTFSSTQLTVIQTSSGIPVSRSPS